MSEYSSSPNPLSTDKTKDSVEFGLKVCQSAYDDWKNGNGTGTAYERKKRYDYNRAYAMGKQPMQEFIDMIEVEGVPTQVNLDYTPLPIAIPFIKRLKDRNDQRIEKIQCNAIDPFTQSKKKTAKDNALHKMKEKDRIIAVQQEAGVPLEEFSDNDPQDEHELNIEFGFNYKEKEEVIMEGLVDIVFYDNNWTSVKKNQIQNHIINCGFAPVCCYMDANGRIKFRVIKPEDFVCSYSEEDDFSDWEWMGEVYKISIAEVRLKYPGKFTEEKLFELAKSQAADNSLWNDSWSYTSGAINQPYDSFKIEVIELDYKTLYNLNYEVNVDRFGKEVLDKTTKFKEGKEYQKSKPYYVTYTGVLVPGTQYLLEWNVTKNLIKPEQNLTEVYSKYAVYMYDNVKMNNTPLMETMIPCIKAMTNISLQAQKIIASTAPDGYMVDISALSDISLGEGAEDMSPMQLYAIFLQTGVQYFKSVDDGDDDSTAKKAPPIQPSLIPFSPKLEALDKQWYKEHDKLTMIVGSNSLDQGNITNQAVGKQVLQDARQMGEGPTNYIYNSYLFVMQRIAFLTRMRGWDILVYGKKGYDGYRMALGEEKIEYIKLEATDDFEKTNFDVKVVAVIDKTEYERLNVYINTCLAQKEITLADAIDCQQLSKTNIKYASYMLASRINRRKREAAEEAQRNNEMAMQANQLAAQEASKGAMELEQMKHQNAIELAKVKLEADKHMEMMKFSGILKSEVVKGTLAKEGGTFAQIPAWVFEGLDLVAKTETQILNEAMQDRDDEEAAEQLALEEEQMMAEQEQMQQNQM